jgi:CelD/BcsL family acetyltransferase involved in cellulose biosynthesis
MGTGEKQWTVISRESGPQTYFEIADSWELQLASLSHEQRRTMRRKYERILQTGKAVECVAATEQTLEHMFSEFVDCHQSNWERQGKPGHFGAWPGSRSFHKEVAAAQLKHGRLRLYEVRVDQAVIGYNYGYKFGDTYYYLLFGRKFADNDGKIDFVRIDFAEMVKRAAGEEVKWFDTMRGRYDYKLHLGGKLLPTRDLFIVSHRAGSRARMLSVRLLARSLRIGYAKVWRSWLAPRRGMTAQAFWDKWLECESFAF